MSTPENSNNTPVLDAGELPLYAKPVTPRHKLYEDLVALLCASLLVGLGIYFFKTVGLIVGGTAGLALIISSVSPFSFGVVYSLLNMPFMLLAYLKLGWRFTLNTFVSVSVISAVADNLHYVLDITYINPVFAAVSGGVMIGLGVLAMFRHHSSLGGAGIVGFYLQKYHGVRAGRFQMLVDVVVVSVGFFLIPFKLLALSILGAVVMNMIIAINHKNGRYQVE